MCDISGAGDVKTLLGILNSTLARNHGVLIKVEHVETPSSGACANLTAADGSDADDVDAFLYIIIVILFYAFSIVILMAKYMRQEAENALLHSYYVDFVRRDKLYLTLPPVTDASCARGLRSLGGVESATRVTTGSRTATATTTAAAVTNNENTGTALPCVTEVNEISEA
ncbi:PREDICTED: uncharacterized protein LOC106814633 [Priapulus caudatus]|uniref:Uncharacterized protein LOC106814633 n=1 Tax=Priapulus caudatus TaxID=37621 RepID=A0ABM1EQI6_PRICU|nr:PREDICTED: uncharacterized protein LOC106814633 [Priapulus caudatus]